MELIFVLVAFLIVFIAQQTLNFTYSKYKQIEVDSNLTGYEVAKKILLENGLDYINVGKVSGNLSDHYNNSKKIINLSDDIYNGTTIASCAVAAHECGHAIQYKEGYIPIKIRNMLVPFVNLGNSLGYIVIVISLASSLTKLFILGLILISFALLFQLITLPCEFDASKRANKILLEMGLITEGEQEGTKKMLMAAAFTYVAGLISSIMQILRLVYIFCGNRRRD
ncbi:MAG: zinc metallopeptidase [Bacilli bacterium]|nr:zinc metallopeptidase [Bacilli bacterium]